MKVIATRAEILDESERHSFISNYNVTPGGVSEHEIVPVQEMQGALLVEVSLRERLPGKCGRKGQVGGRNEIASLYLSEEYAEEQRMQALQDPVCGSERRRPGENTAFFPENVE